jgi:hypothetical protein
MASWWQPVVQFSAVAVPVAAALIAISQGPGRLRAQIKTDVEILEKLPEDSSARTSLLGMIEKKIALLVNLELRAPRRPGYAVMFATLAVINAFAIYHTLLRGPHLSVGGLTVLAIIAAGFPTILLAVWAVQNARRQPLPHGEHHSGPP